jgi:hypothetical protein
VDPLGAQVPAAFNIAAAMVVGPFPYGNSLVLFIFAMRNVGIARAGAYFSIAPFLRRDTRTTRLATTDTRSEHPQGTHSRTGWGKGNRCEMVFSGLAGA